MSHFLLNLARRSASSGAMPRARPQLQPVFMPPTAAVSMGRAYAVPGLKPPPLPADPAPARSLSEQGPVQPATPHVPAARIEAVPPAVRTDAVEAPSPAAAPLPAMPERMPRATAPPPPPAAVPVVPPPIAATPTADNDQQETQPPLQAPAPAAAPAPKDPGAGPMAASVARDAVRATPSAPPDRSIVVVRHTYIPAPPNPAPVAGHRQEATTSKTPSPQTSVPPPTPTPLVRRVPAESPVPLEPARAMLKPSPAPVSQQAITTRTATEDGPLQRTSAAATTGQALQAVQPAMPAMPLPAPGTNDAAQQATAAPDSMRHITAIVEHARPAQPPPPVLQQPARQRQPAIQVSIGNIDLRVSAPDMPKPRPRPRRRQPQGFESYRQRRSYTGWEE